MESDKCGFMGIRNPKECHYLIINKEIANEYIELGKKNLHAEVKQKLFGIISILQKQLIKS